MATPRPVQTIGVVIDNFQPGNYADQTGRMNAESPSPVNYPPVGYPVTDPVSGPANADNNSNKNSRDMPKGIYKDDHIDSDIPLGALNTDAAHFSWDGDDDTHSIKTLHRPGRLLRCLNRVGRLPLWARTFLYMFSGSVLIMVPGVIDFCITTMVDDPSQKHFFYRKFKSSRMQIQGLIPTYALSIWGLVSFNSWFAVRFAVIVAPNLILRIFNSFFGSVTKFVEKWVSYIIHLRVYIQWVFWALISYVVWLAMFNSSYLVYQDPRYVPINDSFPAVIRSLLLLFLLGGIVLLFEKFVLQICAISFHRMAYSDRLDSHKRTMGILERLNTIRRRRLDINNVEEVDEEDEADSQESPSKMAGFLDNVKQHASKALNATSDIAKGLAADVRVGLKTVVTGGPGQAVVLLTLQDAKSLARKLFYALLLDKTKDELTLKDFEVCFSNPADAERAFAFFDKNGNGDISKLEMKNAIVEFYKDHQTLGKSLRDSSQAITKLDSIFMAFVYVVLLFITLSVFSVDYTALLASITALWVGMLFAVGPTCKTLLESLLLLFVVHPFDVGDQIVIDNETYTVKEFGLLTTVFRHTSNKEIYVSNAILGQKFIHNIRRSGALCETVVVPILLSTSSSQIAQFQKIVLAWLQARPRDFASTCVITIREIIDKKSMLLAIPLEFRGNSQDGGKNSSRKNEFMHSVRGFLTDCGIQLTDKSTYGVDLTTNMQPLAGIWNNNAEEVAHSSSESILTNATTDGQSSTLLGAAPDLRHRTFY